MTVIEFEEKVFEIEEVRIVIRARSNTQIKDYSYKKSYPQGNSISDWIKTRVTPNVSDYDVVVIDGTGANPHRGMLMKRLKKTYVDRSDM